MAPGDRDRAARLATSLSARRQLAADVTSFVFSTGRPLSLSWANSCSFIHERPRAADGFWRKRRAGLALLLLGQLENTASPIISASSGAYHSFSLPAAPARRLSLLVLCFLCALRGRPPTVSETVSLSLFLECHTLHWLHSVQPGELAVQSSVLLVRSCVQISLRKSGHDNLAGQATGLISTLLLQSLSVSARIAHLLAGEQCKLPSSQVQPSQANSTLSPLLQTNPSPTSSSSRDVGRANK